MKKESILLKNNITTYFMRKEVGNKIVNRKIK